MITERYRWGHPIEQSFTICGSQMSKGTLRPCCECTSVAPHDLADGGPGAAPCASHTYEDRADKRPGTLAV